MKEKYENDIIIKKCNKIIEIINEVRNKEIDNRKGELTNEKYVNIIELVLNIVEERIKYISFWEEK